MACAYAKDGQGLSPFNRSLLSDVAKGTEGLEVAFTLIAADWNMQPSLLLESGYARAAGLHVAATANATCVSPASSALYDYYLISGKGRPLLDNILTV